MVKGVVVNVDQQITKQRRKRLYDIADYKNPDGSFKRSRLYIKSVVEVPFLVPVPVNLPDTTPLVTATKTTIVPFNASNSVPANPYVPFYPAPVTTTTPTNVVPALITKTTNVPANCPTIVAPVPNPTITTTVPYNPPTHVLLEPDTITTKFFYANPHTQNSPVPYPTPPPNHVSPVTYTPSPNNSTPTLIADYYGVKWYNSKDVIYLYEVPSLQLKFTNQFGDTG